MNGISTANSYRPRPGKHLQNPPEDKCRYSRYRESICKTKEKQDRIHQIPGKHLQLKIKARQDTPDTGKVSAKQKKSKWRCKFICPPGLESICGSQRRQMQIHQMPGKHLQNFPEIKCRYIGTSESIPSPSIPQVQMHSTV